MNASKDILHQAHRILSDGKPIVLVTMARTRGSSPRAVGTHMLITQEATLGTIGGGQLEHEAIGTAQALLREHATSVLRIRKFSLGADCGQCCGGVADLAFERYATVPGWLGRVCGGTAQTNTALRLCDGEIHRQELCTRATDSAAVPGSLGAACQQLIASAATAMHASIPGSDGENEHFLLQQFGAPGATVAVFGAGHVGRAVVDLLSTLDVEITWVDARPHEFPEPLAANVTPVCRLDAAAIAAGIAPNTLCLVMTHSHALDFDICTTLLTREDIPFCGLIGSASKRSRFERLLKQAGLHEYARRLTCPIGIDGIPGKSPQEIAVAVAAQVLRQLAASNATDQEPAIASLPH